MLWPLDVLDATFNSLINLIKIEVLCFIIRIINTSKRLRRTLDAFCDSERTTTKQFLHLPSTFRCVHVRSIKLFSVKEAINVMSGGNMRNKTINHSVSYNIFLSEAYALITITKPSCCSMLQPLFVYK